jgi:hypothetical protein
VGPKFILEHSCGIVFWGVALNDIHNLVPSRIRGRVALECKTLIVVLFVTEESAAVYYQRT